jgi:hypothetical protein
VQITLLADRTEVIPTLALWFRSRWPDYYAATNVAGGILERLEWVRMGLVLHHGERIALYRCDPHDAPWQAGAAGPPADSLDSGFH